MTHQGILLSTAIGDAYGAGFEYDAPTPERPNALRYVPNTKHPTLRFAGYTDDTQMAIGVAEALLTAGLGNTPSRVDFADSFVNCFRRDPRVGYSRRMQGFMEGCRTGADLIERIRPDSAKSGAAMRSGPLAWLPSLEVVLATAELQARITHDTTGGVLSSCATAAGGFALRTGLCNRSNLPEWLSDTLGYDFLLPWSGPVGSAGLDSVRAAVTLVAHYEDYESVLKAGVDLTGDVDTVLAVACGFLSWDRPFAPVLPDVLVNDLENGAYGRDWLDALDIRCEVAFDGRPRVGQHIWHSDIEDGQYAEFQGGRMTVYPDKKHSGFFTWTLERDKRPELGREGIESSRDEAVRCVEARLVPSNLREANPEILHFP